MDKIGSIDRVRNVQVLHRDEEDKNMLQNERKINLIGHILRRNCLLKHVIEGKIVGRIEVT
jgi:hypothetical protein